MKNKIFDLLQIFVETITGRKCKKCKHCHGDDHCVECNRRIYPIGFERKEK